MDTKKILSTVLIGTMLCSASASAKINKQKVNTTKPVVKVQPVKNQNKKLVLYQGEIVKKTATKNGFDILVKKLDGSSYSYQSLIFHVNNKTVLKVKKADLKPGCKIDVLYSGAVTRSLPGQATANEISNLNIGKTTFLYQGKVTNISDTKFGKMVTVVSDEEKPMWDTVVFIVSSNTKITTGTMSDIKEGLSVKLTHGPAMTMSLPPQTNALSLEILN